MSTTPATPTVLCLMGPTASGKTALAMALANAQDCHVISVDSALIYRGMDIGTGKPSKQEQQQCPHALMDICDPLESYSAARFRADAINEIEWALNQKKRPILVGGTMLYFKALIEGIADLPDADASVRAALEQEKERDGLAAMHARLAQLDAESAARININDPQRILRALEVITLTGQAMSALWQQSKSQVLPYRFVQVALIPDRAWLHERIAQRFDQMLSAGLIDEVKSLKERGDLYVDLPSMRCVGYRQVWEFLDGACLEQEMRERGIAATRQLAKRQYTWLRRWPLDLIMDEKEPNPVGRVLKAV